MCLRVRLCHDVELEPVIGEHPAGDRLQVQGEHALGVVLDVERACHVKRVGDALVCDKRPSVGAARETQRRTAAPMQPSRRGGDAIGLV